MEDEIEYRYEKGKGWVAYRKETTQTSQYYTAYVKMEWDEVGRRYVYRVTTPPIDDFTAFVLGE